MTVITKKPTLPPIWRRDPRGPYMFDDANGRIAGTVEIHIRHDDESVKRFIGNGQIPHPSGQLVPFSFFIKAKTLEEAVENFPSAMEKAFIEANAPKVLRPGGGVQ